MPSITKCWQTDRRSCARLYYAVNRMMDSKARNYRIKIISLFNTDINQKCMFPLR